MEPVPIVDVQLDDTETAAFMLDTGATTSTLSPSIAMRLGLELRGEPERGFSGLGGEYEYRRTRVASLTVAGTRIQELDVQVHDLSPLSEVAGEEVSGILGHDALASHIVKVDYIAKRLALRPPRRTRHPEAVPFVHGPSGAMVLIVDGLLNAQQHARLVIDSGSSTIALAERTARSIGATLIEELREGYPEDFPHWWTNLGSIQVGAACRDDLEAVVYDFAAFDEAIGVQLDGVIGHPFLSRGTLEIDYPNQVLLLH